MKSRFLERVDMTGFALTVVAALVWGVLRDWAGAGAVAVGGAMALMNVIALREVLGTVVRRMSGGDETPPVLAIVYVLKLGALALLLFLLVAVLRVNAVAVAVGVGVVPIAILIESARWNYRAPVPSNDSGA